MPRKRIPATTRAQFQRLVTPPPQGDGVSIAEACRRLGIDKSTGYRWSKGLESSETRTLKASRMQAELPPPLGYDSLSDVAKEMLADFNVFSEKALCRHPAAWRLDAAKKSVDFLRNKDERDYIVANVFPGSGKSTLWTLDIILWLLCGGGTMDPAYGRALRFMLGHESKIVSTHYVTRVRRLLDLTRPYYDKEQQRRAEICLAREFGRFKPDTQHGEESLWRSDQFLVAQLQDIDLYEKEPTVQAASQQAGFLGERVDYAVWDDLVTSRSTKTPEASEAIAKWFEDEAETRVEPGGVLWLIGQRLGPLDLFRDRLNKQWTDDEGIPHNKYHHIVYPAHNESTCDGSHRQWDLGEEGCILDEYRLPWKEIVKLRNEPNFRVVYQQEDTDPSTALVLPIWIEGGTGPWLEEHPGCYDKDRGFWEWPKGVKLVNYVTVDVAATGWWAIEWWAVEPHTNINYLIYGTRKKMGANDLLDWNNANQKHIGLMEELQTASVLQGQAIRVWVIESNACQRHLFQYEHFHRWKRKWGYVDIIAHQTQKNKLDPVLGVEARIPQGYREGRKRLPRKRGTDSLNYIKHKVHELTTYPNCKTTDTVMADWFGEAHLEDIIRLGTKPMETWRPDVKLPPYLERQFRESRRENVRG